MASLKMRKVLNRRAFGKRSSGTVSARLYDKSREIASGDGSYWKEIWSSNLSDDSPVLRVEFELAREALVQYGVNIAEDAVDCAGKIWTNLTDEWLTHRTATADETRSRWSVSRQWRSVQHPRHLR